MNKVVKISVINSVSNEAFYSFEVEYSSAVEINNIVKHARMLWDNFIIEAETDLFTQSFSHTYSQEVLMSNK